MIKALMVGIILVIGYGICCLMVVEAVGIIVGMIGEYYENYYKNYYKNKQKK